MPRGRLVNPIQRTCGNPTCGKPFETHYAHQKYCAHRCKWTTAAAARVARVSTLAERWCPRCETQRAATEFGKHRSYCRPCYAAWQRDRTARATPEDRRRRAEIKRLSVAKSAAADADYYRKLTLAKFGLSLEAFNALLQRQGGRCAVCQSDDAGGRHGTWHVDHDHTCCPKGKSCGACVRGLLCQNCNLLLGQGRDNPNVLRAAARYLETAAGRTPHLGDRVA